MKVKRLELFTKLLMTGALGGILAGALGLAGCSATRSILALDSNDRNTKPINNPFGTYYADSPQSTDPIVLRTKKGDRSVEVELPRQDQAMTDFVIPMSPAFKEEGGGRSPASVPGANGAVDDSYKDHPPSFSDREIMAAMPQGPAEDEAARHEIETGLGLVPTQDTPQRDKSYLASIDHIKQLYRLGRYEAALIETDSMLRLYQTDPKLYEMRGTLLDRLNKRELAIKAWNQALRLNPNNVSLRRFIEKRQANRGLASP